MAPAYQPVFSINNWNKNIDKIWLPSPARWNSQELKWEWEDKFVLPYFVSCTIFKSMFLLACIVAYFTGIHNPEISSSIYLICQGLLGLLSILLIISDALLCFDGRETLVGANWCYEQEDWLTRYGSSNSKKICAALAAGNTSFILVGGVFAAILVVYSNLDPFVIIIRYFHLDDASLLLRAARCICMIYLTQVYTISYRAVSITSLVEGFYRIELLKVLTSQSPTQKCIDLYRQGFIVMQMVSNFENKAVAASMVGIFVCVILGVNTLIIAFNRKLALLCSISVMLIFIALVVLHAIFTIGCSLVEMSNTILDSWKAATTNGFVISKDRKYLVRMINSLQITRLPTGRVGIVDRDIKVNYSQKLLDSIVDSIMLNPQFNK